MFKPNNSINKNLHTNNKTKQEINCFIAGPGTEADRAASAEITLNLHDELIDVFSGIGYFKGSLSLWAKDDVNANQVPLRHIAYVLQEPFKKELERLQEHQILAPLWVDEMVKWCKGFCHSTHT